VFTVGTPVYLTSLHLVWSVYTSYAHTRTASLFALFDVPLCVFLLSVVRWPHVALSLPFYCVSMIFGYLLSLLACFSGLRVSN
jgi:hypothetical protein